MLKDEIKPFWRTFCEEAQEEQKDNSEVQELIDMLRKQAYVEFGITADGDTTIDSFHGGLSIHSGKEPYRNCLIEKINDFLARIEKSIHDFKVNPSK